MFYSYKKPNIHYTIPQIPIEFPILHLKSGVSVTIISDLPVEY